MTEEVQPIFTTLVTPASNATLIHEDDTTLRILELRQPGSDTADRIEPKRKGTFTSSYPGRSAARSSCGRAMTWTAMTLPSGAAAR